MRLKNPLTDTELAVDPRSSSTVVEFGNTTTALDSELDLQSDTDDFLDSPESSCQACNSNCHILTFLSVSTLYSSS